MATIPARRYNLQRVDKAHPCQICGHDHWCTYDPIVGAVACKWVISDEAYGEFGWIHHVTPDPTAFNAAKWARSADGQELTEDEADARDILYNHLRAHPSCKLSAERQQQLHGRGFTEDDVAYTGYFTWPDKSWRGDLVRWLARVAELGESVAARNFSTDHHGFMLAQGLWRLPGLAPQGRSWHQFPMTPAEDALAIPVRDHKRRIIGIRLRHEHGDSKYTWLSSKFNKSGSPVHFAIPETVTDTTQVLIVEGEIKADYVASRLGCIVLGVPGITSIAGILPALEDLIADGRMTKRTRVVVAYDQDAAAMLPSGITKAQNTQNAAKRLATLVTGAGFTAVEFAVWSRTHGKGLDDLLHGGHTYTTKPFQQKTRRGLVPSAGTPVQDESITYSSLAAASDGLKDLVKNLIPARWFPAGKQGLGWHIVQATTGVGKTAITLGRIADLLQGTEWPQVYEPSLKASRPVRILYLCATLGQLEEKTKGYLGAQWRQIAILGEGTAPSTMRPVWQDASSNRDANDHPLYWVMEGRNPAPESTAFCENPRARDVAAKRHLPAADVCAGVVKDGDTGQKNECQFYQTCRKSGYLAAKAKSKEARLVVACYGAYLNGGEEVGEFDLVVIDEDASSCLLEHVEVSSQDTLRWNTLLDQRDPEHDRYPVLPTVLSWWHTAMAKAQLTDKPAVLPILRASVPAGWTAEILLQAAIGSCEFMASKGLDRAICELPYPNEKTIPLRAINDLATTMLAEWQRPEGADSRLRFTPAGSLVLRQPRADLLRLLTAARVLWLDATVSRDQVLRVYSVANALRIDDIPLKWHSFSVTTDVEVWNITDSLYNKAQLADQDARSAKEISETITALATTRGVPARKVAVMTRKDIDEIFEASGFESGHYGKDNTATDRFGHCDILATVGCYVPNIGSIEAEVAAWRYSETPPVDPQAPRRRVVDYPTTGWGKERPTHPDKDVQAAIDHSAWTHETQALGRLRAVRRTGTPLLWVRWNSMPYPDLPVKRLIEHQELRKELGLTSKAKYGVDRMQGVKSHNAASRAKAEAKIAEVVEQIQAAGNQVTPTAIHKLTGVKHSVAQAWLAARPVFRVGVTSVTTIYINTDRGNPPTEHLSSSNSPEATSSIRTDVVSESGLPENTTSIPASADIVRAALRGIRAADFADQAAFFETVLGRLREHHITDALQHALAYMTTYQPRGA